MTKRESLTLLLGLLPHSPLKCMGLRLLNGWRIAPSARIGCCLLQCVDHLVLDEGATLCSGSVYRNLRLLHVGRRSLVGRWNTFSASPGLAVRGLSPAPASLVIGRESAITNRHYMDCSGGISIGSFTTIAGVRSTFLSHSVDFEQGRQRSQAIVIGDYAFVASNCSVMAGARLPDRSILGMGAVLRPGALRSGQLYGGVPARPLGTVQGAYFTRLTGRVES
jgi:acetyltransferase-like isoleucine patch superfamily enzyme